VGVLTSVQLAAALGLPPECIHQEGCDQSRALVRRFLHQEVTASERAALTWSAQLRQAEVANSDLGV
jgi:hypothetical protein